MPQKINNKLKITKNNNSLMIMSFTIFTILMIAMGLSLYLIRDPLSSIIKSYSKEFGSLIIIAFLVVVALIPTVIFFGIFRSTAMYKTKTKHKSIILVGPFAGYCILLVFLIGAYRGNLKSAAEIKIRENVQLVKEGLAINPIIRGNVQLVKAGVAINPIKGANVAFSKYSGYEAETDRNGNFKLPLPPELEIRKQGVTLQITYEGETKYHKLQQANMENVIIKFEKANKNMLEILPGTWNYKSLKGNTRYKKWKINQDGNKLAIQIDNEEEQRLFHVRYNNESNDFSFYFDIPMTVGSPGKLEGECELDDSGDEIKGIWESQGLSDNFILRRNWE